MEKQRMTETPRFIGLIIISLALIGLITLQDQVNFATAAEWATSPYTALRALTGTMIPTQPPQPMTNTQNAVCGNGLVESGEQCDPPDGFVCDATCSVVSNEAVSINVGPATPIPGDLITVALNLNPQAVGGSVWAYQADCTFSSNILGNGWISWGSLFNPQVSVPRMEDGRFVVAVSQSAGDQPVTRAGTVAVVTFQALAEGSGDVTCTFDLLDRNRNALLTAHRVSVPVVITAPLPELGHVTGQVMLGENVSQRFVEAVLNSSNGAPVSQQTLPDGVIDVDFGFVPAGTYNYAYDAPGFISYGGSFSLGVGETRALPPITLIPGDVNDDGAVDITDLSTLGANYLAPASPGSALVELDIDRSGLVDLADLMLIALSWGKTSANYDIPQPPPDPPVNPTPNGAINMNNDFAPIVNQARCTRGLAPLVANDLLFQSAARHSLDMALNHFFSHTGSDGSTFDQRILATGYELWGGAENIGGGYHTVAAVFDGWWNSAGHKANMMNPDLTEFGLALVNDPNSDWGYYWTLNIGNQRNRVTVPTCASLGY